MRVEGGHIDRAEAIPGESVYVQLLWRALVDVDSQPQAALTLEQFLQGLDLPVLNTRIRRRAAYRTAVVEGISVYQLGARGREAVHDIEQVIEEVMQT